MRQPSVGLESFRGFSHYILNSSCRLLAFPSLDNYKHQALPLGPKTVQKLRYFYFLHFGSDNNLLQNLDVDQRHHRHIGQPQYFLAVPLHLQLLLRRNDVPNPYYRVSASPKYG